MNKPSLSTQFTLLLACLCLLFAAPTQAQDDHAGHDHATHETTAKPEAHDDHDEHDEHDDHEGEDDHDDHAEHDDHEGEGDHDDHAEHDDHDDHAGHDDHDEGGPVKISDAVMQEFGIETAEAGPGKLSVVVNLAGELALNPDHVAHVAPRAHGIVRSVHKQVGQTVEAGEQLAVLESAEVAALKAEYLSLIAETEIDTFDLERATALQSNAQAAFELLAKGPGLDELKSLETLDLGASRRDLIGMYTAVLSSRSQLDRRRSLRDKQIASEADLQEAQSSHEQATIDFQAARDAIRFDSQRAVVEAQRRITLKGIQKVAIERQLYALGLSKEDIQAIPTQEDADLSRLEIVAPIAGMIVERHIVRGEQAGPEETVFVIADFATLWAELAVYTKDAPLIRQGLPVRVTLTGTRTSVDGTIAYISPVMDEATRTATARVAITNPDGIWRPGAFVSASAAVSSKAAPVVVPRAALMTVEGKSVVLVKSAGGFEPRPVRTGMNDATRIEILDGLKAGETYISRNAFTVLSEMNKSSFGHAGHAH